MKAKRFSEEQIIGVLKEAEAGAKKGFVSQASRCGTKKLRNALSQPF